MVTVYTLPACVQCDSTKRYLKKNMIEFQEVDMSQDSQALERVRDWGYTQAPVVEYGEQRWSGFRFDELSKLAA